MAAYGRIWPAAYGRLWTKNQGDYSIGACMEEGTPTSCIRPWAVLGAVLGAFLLALIAFGLCCWGSGTDVAN
jgi:hypothetical protein